MDFYDTLAETRKRLMLVKAAIKAEHAASRANYKALVAKERLQCLQNGDDCWQPTTMRKIRTREPQSQSVSPN